MAKIKVEFWLNTDKPEQKKLLTYVEYLQANYRFAPTLRRALTLVGTLDEGVIDELEKQYPMIVDAIRCSKPLDMEGLAQIVAAEVQKILVAMPEKAMMEQPASRESPFKSGPKPLEGAKPLAIPVFDDADTVIIRRDTTSGEVSTNNFHASMMSLMTSKHEPDD